MGPRPHMGRGFQAADWQLGWWIEWAWNGGGASGAVLSLPVN